MRWTLGWLATAALAAACSTADSVNVVRYGLCEAADDGWCRATSTTGFGAEFPAAVVEVTTDPTDLTAGGRGGARTLSAKDSRGARFDFACVEYVSGQPPREEVEANMSTLGTFVKDVKRAGIDGKIVRSQENGSEALFQYFVADRFTCFQLIEAQRGAELPEEAVVDHFLGSVFFGALADLPPDQSRSDP